MWQVETCHVIPAMRRDDSRSMFVNANTEGRILPDIAPSCNLGFEEASLFATATAWAQSGSFRNKIQKGLPFCCKILGNGISH